MSIRRKTDFWLVLSLLILSIITAWANFSGYLQLHGRVGPFFIHHWFSIIGSIYIAIYTPLYYILKRRYPRLTRNLLRLHAYGNVISFGLISIHFTQQITRPPAFYPDLQTGLALYPIVILLVITGFLMRFRLVNISYNTLRSLHLGLTTAFYFTIWVHFLHGLGWINV